MSFISDSRKVVSKVVKGKEIYKAKDTHGVFYIDLGKNKYRRFKTIKEAEQFINWFL